MQVLERKGAVPYLSVTRVFELVNLNRKIFILTNYFGKVPVLERMGAVPYLSET